PAGAEAPGPDTERQECAEQSDVELVEMQKLFTEKKNIDLNERAEKPEVGDPNHCKPERSIPSQLVQPGENLMHRVESERFVRAGRGNARDADARERAEHGDGRHQD